VSAQNLYSLVNRDAEREVVPACEHFGLGLLPYFPLGSGLLTGKYRRGAAAPANTRLAEPGYASRLTNAPWDKVEALERFAAARGLRLLDVAIGGLAAMPAVASVIAGATSPGQVAANVSAARWVPTPEELAELRRITA
jgi:aryl-alcohol dehydrogenase-like predicted oxidoreductase